MEVLAIYLAAGLMIGLGGLGAAIGVGSLARSLLDGCARQPELASSLQTRYYIAMSTIDVIPITALGIGLYLIFIEVPRV
jgi:F-type H+-transporting ATPase subunit c